MSNSAPLTQRSDLYTLQGRTGIELKRGRIEQKDVGWRLEAEDTEPDGDVLVGGNCDATDGHSCVSPAASCVVLFHVLDEVDLLGVSRSGRTAREVTSPKETERQINT